jgi:thiazole synthase ThiGH ThiG subunit
VVLLGVAGAGEGAEGLLIATAIAPEGDPVKETNALKHESGFFYGVKNRYLP